MSETFKENSESIIFEEQSTPLNSTFLNAQIRVSHSCIRVFTHVKRNLLLSPLEAYFIVILISIKSRAILIFAHRHFDITIHGWNFLVSLSK